MEETAERNITSVSDSSYEVDVIGAGQAGLAMGYFLKQQGRRFVILEAADSIGSAWQERWESLTLFTPRRYSGLAGLPFPGDPEGYPDRDERDGRTTARRPVVAACARTAKGRRVLVLSDEGSAHPLPRSFAVELARSSTSTATKELDELLRRRQSLRGALSQTSGPFSFDRQRALGFAGLGIFRSGSTSAYRVPLARLGAAQAALKESGAAAYTAAGG